MFDDVLSAAVCHVFWFANLKSQAKCDRQPPFFGLWTPSSSTRPCQLLKKRVTQSDRRHGKRVAFSWFFNHAIYFACLSPNPANATRVPTGKLLNDITSTFGSCEAFQEKFTQEAASLFGSGYIWLVRKSFDAITANQDSPITDRLKPLMVIDVWEHAYYLKHKYRRNNYIVGD
ncbi:Superoxide dismutase [Mn] [Lamellibrachia satsuma]|nr:Superoxide dismutase [Mn] [Lamellibrachia satsuma]